MVRGIVLLILMVAVDPVAATELPLLAVNLVQMAVLGKDTRVLVLGDIPMLILRLIQLALSH